jgi:CBS domain-containing protein
LSAPAIRAEADARARGACERRAMDVAASCDRIVEARRTFPFAGSRVRDAMSAPIRACPPDLPLVRAAEVMAAERIHCLAVVRPPARFGEAHVGIVTDLDLVAALSLGLEDHTVADVAAAPAFTIPSDARLPEAAGLLHDLGTHHLVVVEPATGRPLGVLSTLDLLRALAWGQPPAPPA